MPRTFHPDIHAILLDRDGVINRERKDYVKCWREFDFILGALLALRRLAAYSWPILVITNQSAIGRNIVSERQIDEIHRQLTESVRRKGGRIDAFFVCPHRPEEQCGCRKPKPGLLTQAAEKFDLDLTQCLFIGDSLSDYLAASAVNCPAILVKSEYPDSQRQLQNYPGVMILPDLLSVVTFITGPSWERSKVTR